MPPIRRSPRPKSADPSEEAGSDPQHTRVRSSTSVRRGAPPEEREEDWAAPSEEEGEYADEGDSDEAYAAEGTPSAGPAWEDDDDNPDATRAGPPLVLEILEGPDRGKRKRFKSVRMVIGRGQDCDVMLADQSVSRRHVELVFGDGGVLLRDLGSGNGTKVNDERADECLLAHEDVICIGRTKLRLIDEQERIRRMRAEAEEAERKQKEEAERKDAEAAAAASLPTEQTGRTPEEAPAPESNGEESKATQVRDIRDIPRPRRDKPKRRMGLFVAGGLVLLLALVGGGLALVNRGPPPPPPPDPKVEQARALLQQARTAFRQADYAEAVRLAEEAEALWPGVDSEGFGEAARKELAIIQAFQQVRQLMEENEFDEARELLARTPQGIASSTEEERKRLVAELDSRETEHLVRRVEALLEARDVEGARALIRQLPIERQPLYLSRLAEVEAALASEAMDEAARQRALKASAARRAKEERAAFVAAAFGVVETRFNSGDYSRAALECDRVIDAHRGDKEIRDRARSLKKLIPQFARVYQDAQRKVRANALESAARPLRSSAELYRRMGFQGPMVETLNGQLAVSSLVAGKGALARNDLAAAASHFNEALRLSPEEPKALEGLASLQGRLRELYMQGYVQRDREPDAAAEKFRLVVQLAAEGSELKGKAEAQLLELQP